MSFQSSQKSVGAQADEEHKAILVSTKVRAIIMCRECTKPRVVYAKSKLNEVLMVTFKQVNCAGSPRPARAGELRMRAQGQCMKRHASTHNQNIHGGINKHRSVHQ